MKLLFDREEQFDRLLTKLNTLEPASEEYQKILENVNILVHIDKAVHPHKPSTMEKILANAPLIGGFFSLAATGMVLYHERLDVITSRAFGWIRFK